MKKLILSLLIFCSAFASAQISIPQVTGLPAALNSKVDKVTGKSLVADTLSAKIQPHVTNTANPHSTTKAQVGLGNVDNTSDINKPISSATQTALNGKQPTGTYSTDIHSNITALNAVSGTNTGDETLTSIKTKLGAASSVSDGYLERQDWSKFNEKSGRSATLSIASFESTDLQKSQSDYVCDGTDDQVQINAAINSLTTGGLIHLSGGTFNISASININRAGIILRGEGRGYTDSNLKYGNTLINAISAIYAVDCTFTDGDFFLLQDLTIKGMNTSSPLSIGLNIGSSDDVQMENCYITIFQSGVRAFGSATNPRIINNWIEGNGIAINIDGDNPNLMISGNLLGYSNENCINISNYDGTYPAIVTGNTMPSGESAMSISNSKNILITSNSFTQAGQKTQYTYNNILITGASLNITISGNTFNGTNGAVNWTGSAIYIPSANYVFISGNNFYNYTVSAIDIGTGQNLNGAIGQNVGFDYMQILNKLSINNSASIPVAPLQIGTLLSGTRATYHGNLLISDNKVNGANALGGIEFENNEDGYGYKMYTNNSNDYFGFATRYNSASWTERFKISQTNGNATFLSTVNSTGFLLNGNNLTSSLTASCLSKWNGTNFVNSLITDNGTLVKIGNEATGVGTLQLYGGASDHNYNLKGNSSTGFEIWHGTFGAETTKQFSISSTDGDAKIYSTTTASLPTNGALVIVGGVGADHVRANYFYGNGSNLTGVQLPITLTTNGTSGAATFSGNTLNVPNYTASGGVNQTQTTVSGSTSGNIVGSMPFQTGSYKKVMIRFSALSGNASYPYPTVFTTQPSISPIYQQVGTSGTYTTGGAGASAFTITGASGLSGWIIIEGY